MPFDLAFNRACKFLPYLSNFDPNSHMQLNKRIGIFSLLPLTWFGFNFKTAGGNVKGESCYDPTKPVGEQQGCFCYDDTFKECNVKCCGCYDNCGCDGCP